MSRNNYKRKPKRDKLTSLVKSDPSNLFVKKINSDVGFGLFTNAPIGIGEYVVEYKGEIITAEEADHRRNFGYLFYFQHEGSSFCVDAYNKEKAGIARYANDEWRRPNTRVVKEEVNGKAFLFLKSIRPIERGDEIRYNYNDRSAPWRWVTEKSKKIGANKNDATDHRSHITGVMCTGIAGQYLKSVQTMAKTYGWEYHMQYHAKVSHIIVRTDPIGSCIADKTLKFYQGVANKCWLLDMKWVLDSSKCGQVLPEKEYEINGLNRDGTPSYGPRESRTSSSLFLHGFEFQLEGFSTNSEFITEDEIKDLVKACGGEIVLSSRHFNKQLKNIVIRNSEEPLTHDPEEVPLDWLLDGIEHFCVQPNPWKDKDIVGNNQQSSDNDGDNNGNGDDIEDETDRNVDDETDHNCDEPAKKKTKLSPKMTTVEVITEINQQHQSLLQKYKQTNYISEDQNGNAASNHTTSADVTVAAIQDSGGSMTGNYNMNNGPTSDDEELSENSYPLTRNDEEDIVGNNQQSSDNDGDNNGNGDDIEDETDRNVDDETDHNGDEPAKKKTKLSPKMTTVEVITEINQQHQSLLQKYKQTNYISEDQNGNAASNHTTSADVTVAAIQDSGGSMTGNYNMNNGPTSDDEELSENSYPLTRNGEGEMDIDDLVSNGADLVSNGADLVSNGDDLVSNGDDLVSNEDDLVSNGDDLVSNRDDIVSNGDDPDYEPSSEDESASSPKIDVVRPHNEAMDNVYLNKCHKFPISEPDFVPASDIDEEEEDFLYSSSSKENESTNQCITVRQTSNDSGRIYDKAYPCLFCSEFKKKIPRHLEAKHSDKVDVYNYLNEDDPQKKRNMMIKLRNLGIHKHNYNVIQEQKGELLVAYRPSNKSASWTDYVPCEHCLGYYCKSEFWKHVQRCPLAPTDRKKYGKVLEKGRLLLPTANGCSIGLNTVLSSMTKDDITMIIKGDPLITELGQHISNKHGHDQDKHSYIRNTLRESARLVKQLREVTGKKEGLSSFLCPKYYNEVVIATKQISGYDEMTQKYTTPSLALKVGYSTKKCCLILKGKAIINEDEDQIKNAEGMLELMKIRWHNDISDHADRSLKENKLNNPKMIPLVEDVVLLNNYLKTVSIEAYQQLEKDKSNYEMWSLLNKATLALLILFNRRRVGEASKMTTADYNAKDRTFQEDIMKSLSPLEKKLCTKLKRVEIIGKNRRIVPVILTSILVSNINMLLSCRASIGVNSENSFVFARAKYGSGGHLRGSDCLREFSVACGAKFPELITSTKLRKQIATLSQILNLKENELDILARFLGHDIRTHREYYRLSQDAVEVAKVSKLLLSLENGTILTQSNHSLDDITIDANEEVFFEADVASDGDDEKVEDSDDEEGLDEKTGTKGTLYVRTEKTKKTQCKRPWTNTEKQAVLKHFHTNILLERLPGKEDINKCKLQEPSLNKRSWRNIKYFIKNAIVSKSKNQSQ